MTSTSMAAVPLGAVLKLFEGKREADGVVEYFHAYPESICGLRRPIRT